MWPPGEGHLLFGSEAAESDDLLHDCFVRPPNDVIGKPILAGRWGTGKTAYMFHLTHQLATRLKQIDPTYERLWYIPENSIDIPSIGNLSAALDNDIRSVKRCIEGVWEAEIISSYLKQLDALKRTYGNVSGPHWDFVIKAHRTHVKSEPIWELAGNVVSGLFGKDKGDALSKAISILSPLTSDEIKIAINQCIADIPAGSPIPIVAVEPIETPNSQLETATPEIADIVITCLLNVFIRLTETQAARRIRTIIAIPWHRFKDQLVSQPQKLSQYIGQLRWDRTNLRNFINQRLSYELKKSSRANQRPSNIDPWAFVFGRVVQNPRCGKLEDSFSYVLRHSHYRVREVIRFARKAVQTEANIRTTDVYDVLNTRQHPFVSPNALLGAVNSVSRETARERITEGDRRFPNLYAVVEAMKGMTVPFSADNLNSRLQKANLLVDGKNISHYLDVLWQSGIIGCQMIAPNGRIASVLEGRFGSEAQALDHSASQPIPSGRFYVFKHTALTDDQHVHGIMHTARDAEPQFDFSLVLHPMMFEHFGAHPSSEHPIGV